MIQSCRKNFSLIVFYKSVFLLLIIISINGCEAQSSKDSIRNADTTSKIIPESLSFVAQTTETNADGSKAEIDTITGYHKYYYSNGKLQMEGKVTKSITRNYRDGIWKYYNEQEQLMRQETYNKEGKVNSREFMYFTNNKPLSETYQYFEGDYRDKSAFKFHKIEKLYYSNGQELSERHWINKEIVNEKCWDSKGNSQPIEYLKTLKSVQANE